MAKKKKPAANPARGFATTSIAKKPRPEKEEDSYSAPREKSKDERLETPKSGPESNVSATKDSELKELHKLSPEELEEQLERNELQLLVETYGPKVRRDVNRLNSKLRTDGRVLRAQSHGISLRQWLPEELMVQVLDLFRKEKHEARQSAKRNPGSKALSEEETVIRCWTLLKALLDLGVPREHAFRAIAEVLKNPPNSDSSSYVWGFKASLDFLALELEEGDLPSFDGKKARNGPAIEGASCQGTAISTPLSSRPVSPEPVNRSSA